MASKYMDHFHIQLNMLKLLPHTVFIISTMQSIKQKYFMGYFDLADVIIM